MNRLVLMIALIIPITQVQPPSRVTFTEHVAPIVLNVCATCHRPGEAAPFSLLTYADAKSHARLIEEVTKRRLMPPWLPAADDPKFADDLRLSDADIARITFSSPIGAWFNVDTQWSISVLFRVL